MRSHLFHHNFSAVAIFPIMLILLYSLIAPSGAATASSLICTKPEGTTLRSGPGTDYDRIAIFPFGAELPLISEEEGWCRVRISPALDLYALKDDVKKSDSAISSGILQVIKPRDEENFPALEFRLDKPCCYAVGQDLRSNAYILTLFNTKAALFECIYPKNLFITQYDMRLEATDTLSFVLPVNASRLWGYKVELRERAAKSDEEKGGTNLIFSVRKPPVIEAPGSHQNITIVIDPGHGGKNYGAVGRDGLKEKEINLRTALFLKEVLIRDGYRVVMTREEDREVAEPGASDSDELQRRVDVAEKAGGNIFISIHYNAKKNIDEGRVAKGTYIYFYHPQSLALAQSIANTLAASIEEEKHASIGRSFHVTRQTTMPAVLIEGAFLSNPDEEKKLRDDSYLKRIAGGIHRGIREFFGENRGKENCFL